MLYKTFKNKDLFNLFKVILEKPSSYATRNVDGIPLIKIKHTKTLSPNLQSLNGTSQILQFGTPIVLVFQNQYPQIYQTHPRSVFNCYNHKGIRLITRFCAGLRHLREHKFNHNFQNGINPLCSCGMDVESTSHFFLHCPLFDDKRITLLSTLSKTD